jgi:hypothetical protein
MTLEYDYMFDFPPAAQTTLAADKDMAETFSSLVQGTATQPTADEMKAVVSAGFDKAAETEPAVKATVDAAKTTITAKPIKVEVSTEDKANFDKEFTKRAQESGTIAKPAATSTSFATLAVPTAFVYFFSSLLL